MTIIRQVTIKGSDACLPASASLLQELYPTMHINKWCNIQSMQKIITTVTLQTCQWPAAFQPWRKKITRGSSGQTSFETFNCCLVVVWKLSVPSNYNNVCHTFLFRPGKWVMQKTLWQQLLIWFCTSWFNLNLLKDDYSRPTPHNQWCQCGFCPRITKETQYTCTRIKD